MPKFSGLVWLGQVWNKLGHICMDSVPVQFSDDLKTCCRRENIRTKDISVYGMWYFIRYSYIYTNTPKSESSPNTLQLSTCLQKSQGNGGHNGQTNNCVSGAVDLWDLKAFTDVPPLNQMKSTKKKGSERNWQAYRKNYNFIIILSRSTFKIKK